MEAKPGFYKRLRTACKANDVGEDELARVIRGTIEDARELLQTDVGSHVRGVTLFRVADRTGYSARWMLTGKGSCSARRDITPDQQWLLDRFLDMDQESRDRLTESVKRILYRQSK